MQDAAEPGRLDELRRRAYGRGAVLGPDEAAELHALEQQARAQRAAERPQPVAPASAVGPDPERGHGRPQRPPAAELLAGAPERAAAPDPDVEANADATGGAGSAPGAEGPEADAAPAEDAERTDAAAASGPWRRRLIAGVAAVAAVAIGVGIGWALAPKTDAAPAMSEAQTDTWATLEGTGDFDPGSIELLGDKDGASLWKATSANAELDCLILTLGEKESRRCLDPDLVQEYGMLSVSLQADHDGTPFQYWGSLLTDLQGRDIGYLQTQDLAENNTGWEAQYSSSELAEIRVLENAGYDGPSLWLMGYDGDRPVWMSQSGESCIAIVVDGQVIDECGADPSTPDMLRLTVDDTSYEVLLTSNRGLQLTIVRNTDTTVHCSPGESTVDQTCTTIDDKTGAKTE